MHLLKYPVTSYAKGWIEQASLQTTLLFYHPTQDACKRLAVMVTLVTLLYSPLSYRLHSPHGVTLTYSLTLFYHSLHTNNGLAFMFGLHSIDCTTYHYTPFSVLHMSLVEWCNKIAFISALVCNLKPYFVLSVHPFQP